MKVPCTAWGGKIHENKQILPADINRMGGRIQI